MCDRKECPLRSELIAFQKNWIEPASRRAREKTKYDFHAGYNKACRDMLKKLEETLAVKQ